MSAGYSTRTLSEKLGLRAGMKVVLIGAPSAYREQIHPLPDDLRISHRLGRSADFVQLFARSTGEITRRLEAIARAIHPDGMVWICWPKKSSGVKTELSGDVVRGLGLKAGLVDVKVAAVDETWSGLKFVHRVKNR